MTARPLQQVIRQLRRAAGPSPPHGATDAQLLERFVGAGDQEAFELLVWRHAQTVLGVCRRVLRHEQNAEDCFQAAFLALAREAGRISGGESVGGWLYRVAYRVALRAKAQAVRRAARQQPLAEPASPSTAPGPCEEAAWRELREGLDEQVRRLPAVYREVFVLRCLTGKSSEEVAAELGCPVGTVESRLARARQRLREGLARRGLAPSAMALAGLAGGGASVPAPWVASAVKAAALATAGKWAEVVGVSARAAAWSEVALGGTLMTKLKVATVMLLALGCLAGFAGLAYRASAEQPAASDEAVARQPEKPAQPRADKEKAARERLEKEVQELRTRLLKMQATAEVAELTSLLLKKEREDLRSELERRKQEIDGVLTRVDAEKNAIGLTLGATQLAMEGVPLSPRVKVYLGDKERGVKDLKPGMAASLRVGTEGGKAVVTAIRARVPKKE